MIVPERRALRRRLGPVAWCVLEDLLDDARVDALGRRVATSSVRRLAENLGVSKDTTARALRRLTSAQLIAALPAPRADGGRFGGGAYLICAAAAVEDIATAGERSVEPPASRRLRSRSTAVRQPSLFDAAADHGATERESAPAAEVEARTGGDAGRGDEAAGARTGRREDAGREGAGREAEAPGRRGAG